MNNLDKKDSELKQKNHLMAYDLLKTLAGWLDNPDNEVFGLLEFDEDSLSIAAKASVLAAGILKKAAIDIQIVSGVEDTNKYKFDISDALENLVSMANEFDNSDNPELVKKAGLIDEIILTMSSSIEEEEKFKRAMEEKIENIKKRSREKVLNNKAISDSGKKVNASIDDVEGNEYRPLQAPLSSRSFPGSPGTPMVRVSDNVWYNLDTGEEVDFSKGYKLDGKNVPGTSVENQTDFGQVSIPNQFK